MSLSECDKCGEMVDEAKAFCPGCGRAFVDENIREKSSEFNMLDGTMQLGNTMYNQMLSDMGLNISASPDKPVEAVQPATPVYTPQVQPVQQVLQPAVQKVIQPAVPVETPKQEGSNKWMIIGAIVIIVLIILIIAAIVIGLFLWSRFG